MSYGNGISANYTFEGVPFDTAFTRYIQGPAGAEGRLISVSHVVDIQTTGSDTTVEVGNSGDADAYGTHAIAAAVAGLGGGVLTRGVDTRIDADSVVEVVGDGGLTAGDGTLNVLIEWYGGDAS